MVPERREFAVIQNHVGTIFLGVHEQIVSLDDVRVGDGFQYFILQLKIGNEFGVTAEALDCIDCAG